MTTYYGLYGQKVQYLASDPTDVQTGQVWYNSTSATLKVRAVTVTNAWASGGNMNTAREGPAGAGTQTAGLAFGGASPSATGATENYDGTVWTSSPPMTTARRLLAGAGTLQAGLGFGGYIGPESSATEEWSGPQTTATASTITTS